MKKKILHINIVLFVLLIISIFMTNTVNADSIAGINCPSSLNLNQNFTVSLILPSNAYAAEATVTVKFSNGVTDSAKLVYVQGMSDFPNSVSFTAKSAGAGTVTISNVIISDSNSNALENGGSKSQGFNVVDGNTPTTPTTPAAPKFTDVNEIVYTTDRCNIRESYSTDSKKITTVDKDTDLKRTGVGDNGWSRIEYNGKTCYISSQYVTKEKPADPEFKAVEEKMYATQNCNLRASWSTNSDKVGYLEAGQEVTRIGVADNGWSKIKVDGKEVYVATRLLQSEPLEEEKPEETEENPEEPETTDELATIKEQIGVLPEVGNNVTVYIYAVLAIIMTLISVYGIYYTNKK